MREGTDYESRIWGREKGKGSDIVILSKQKILKPY